jgi:predicted subunit of tRNA(5-methylaminomethyl-2-thiouridylate) methyltransferase
MRCLLLYSGGKDSTLVALLLREFYDLTLVTVHFGRTEDYRHAAETAAALDLPFEELELDDSVAIEAVNRMVEDGYPRNGIQHVHQEALEAIAERNVAAIADGTRRDDRVPTVSRAQAQSLEDRHDVDYLAPLWGFGRRAVDRLVDAELTVVEGPSEEISRADYEAELRAILSEEYGQERVAEVFPDHEQTHVTGRRE